METKICTKCKIEQPIENFSKQRNKPRTTCKKCSTEYNKKRLECPEKKKHHLALIKEYRINLSEEQKALLLLKKRARKRGVSLDVIIEEDRIFAEAEKQNKKFCYGCSQVLDKSCFMKHSLTKDGLNTKCRECRRKDVMSYYNENKELIYERKKPYLEKNRRRILDRQKDWVKNKRKVDPVFKLTLNVRSRLKTYLRIKKMGKTAREKLFELFGCTAIELKEHIERQFTEGMSWDNYSYNGWHVDHIIPLATAKTKEDVIKLNHYTNLRPLWAVENMKKGKKML